MSTKTGTSRSPESVLAAARPIAEDVCRRNDLVLWSAGWKREAGRDMLSVACDRRGGVGSDELARVSEELSRALDRSDAVPGDARYVLEVTSPGAERKLETLEQFDICTGRDVHVVTKDGRAVDGKICGVTGHAVDVDGTHVMLDDIAKARLVVKF